MAQERTVRNLLLALGIGEYQAQMITPNMFQAPATTDPKSPHIMMVVQAIQQKLIAAGYQISPTSYLDSPTAAALDDAVGSGWESSPWSNVITQVLATTNTPGDYSAADNDRLPAKQENVAFSDIASDLGLPAVPGGIITYGIGAYLLYRWLSKGKRKSA